MNKVKTGPVGQLSRELAELREKSRDCHDRYVRVLAELENFRRRTQRELESAGRHAQDELMIGLLPVLDNLDRAFAAAKADPPGHNGDAMRQGIEMIQRQLREVLARFGLEEYSCIGSEFDPRIAEAVSFVHSREHARDTVVEECCRGYRCAGRVIRPARVVVAKPAADWTPDTIARDAAGGAGGATGPSN